MKTIVMSALCAMVMLSACNKKEPQATMKELSAAKTVLSVACSKEIISTKPVKVGETGILIPAGTKICLAKDNSEIRVELPKDYSFAADGIASRPLPIGVATYHCICSGGGACQVTYIDELGFGCMHSNCSGGCTGAFTYKGYSVNRIINLGEDKEKFFADPSIQIEIANQYATVTDKDAQQRIYGVSYFFQLPGKASCDCEGTKACTLKTLGITMEPIAGASFKIYYCDGPCNGCELTVN